MRNFDRRSKNRMEKKNSPLRNYLWATEHAIQDWKELHPGEDTISLSQFEGIIDDIVDICTSRGRF